MLGAVVGLALLVAGQTDPEAVPAGRSLGPEGAASEPVPVGPVPAVVLQTLDERRGRVRLRAGVGGGGTVDLLEFRDPSASLRPVPGFGVAGDLGVQFDDRFALYARTTLSTLVIAWSASAALLAEVGFDRFSLATGVGLSGLVIVWGSAASVTIPVVVGITPFGRADSRVGRAGFHLWLEGDVAVARLPAEANLPFTVRLHVGYVWR